MISPFAGQVVLGIYAALLAAGGAMGYVKGKSVPSLVAGLVSGGVAGAACGLSALGHSSGFAVGLILSLVMFVFFGARFRSKRKFMPMGMLAVVSMIVLILMGLAVS